MHNVMNSNIGNQEDIRPTQIIKGLDAAAQLFGENNWSIFEIFTYATKVVEMGVEHARNNRVAYPKTLGINLADGTRIEFTVRKPISKAEQEIRDKIIQDQTIASLKKPH